MDFDVTSLLGAVSSEDSSPDEKSPSIVEYRAQVASTMINGDATIKFTEDGLLISTVLDTVEIPFAEVDALSFEDYVVAIDTAGDRITLSKLGNWGRPFYGELVNAYNVQVLKSLFTHGDPLIAANGGYRYRDEAASSTGEAPVLVFENCVCVLPPDVGARRIPLHFLTGLEKGEFSLTHRVDEDEYTFTKLGYETDPFENAVITQTKALREKTQAMVKEIDPTLTASQSMQIATLMPGGAAAPVEAIKGIAPSFVKTAEEAIAKSRADEYYTALKEMGDSAQVHLGFIRDDTTMSHFMGEDSAQPEEADEQNAEETAESQENSSPYLFYAIVPSKDGSVCAVEFAVPEGESAATFLYRTDGDFSAFARRINRAMEAVDYARDVISIENAKLTMPENRRYAMAVKRSPALARVREGFIGRVIHSSLNAWKGNLAKHFA